MTGELDPGPNPARITIRRMVEFGDIDSSGHYHNACVVRWLEAAEAVLHKRLGISETTFGQAPRVNLEISFLARLYFMDEVDITLTTVHVGRSSVRYGLSVESAGVQAAAGGVVTAHLPRGAERAQPWPPEVRTRLREGGDQS